MKYGALVAARTGSSRLPGKALLPLGGEPMIVFLLKRLLAHGFPAPIVFATTELAEDDRLADTVAALGVPVFRGANADVVGRFTEAANAHGIEYAIRITGDCPFVDGPSLAACLEQCDAFGRFDLATTKGTFPAGIDYEIYRTEVMRGLHRGTELDAADREHLTKFFYDHPDLFDIRRLSPPGDWPRTGRAFTVDAPEDYEYAKSVVRRFGHGSFPVAALLEFAHGET